MHRTRPPAVDIGCCAFPHCDVVHSRPMPGIEWSPLSGHRVRWRPPSGSTPHDVVHSRTGGARRASPVRWRAPDAGRRAHRRRGGRGWRAPTLPWRAAPFWGACDASATRAWVAPGSYITQPLDRYPHRVPNVRYGTPACAADHAQLVPWRARRARHRTPAGRGACARAGGALGARTEDVVRRTRPHRCAHHHLRARTIVRWPGSAAHHGAHRCGGRECSTSSVCAPVRTMPCIVTARCAQPKRVAHRMLRGPALPHRPVLARVESTPIRWTSRWTPLPLGCSPVGSTLRVGATLHSVHRPLRTPDARWSPPCPLNPGVGAGARCAMGSAGHRGTAVSGSGAGGAAASVTGTAPRRAADSRRRAAPGARVAPARAAVGSV
jgi:hypothetical protein